MGTCGQARSAAILVHHIYSTQYNTDKLEHKQKISIQSKPCTHSLYSLSLSSFAKDEGCSGDPGSYDGCIMDRLHRREMECFGCVAPLLGPANMVGNRI